MNGQGDSSADAAEVELRCPVCDTVFAAQFEPRCSRCGCDCETGEPEETPDEPPESVWDMFTPSVTLLIVSSAGLLIGAFAYFCWLFAKR
jgi:hypothetical protein